MNRRKLLQRLSRGAVRNVSFADLRGLVEAFGFRCVRVSGSHRIFTHPGVPALLNLQDYGGEAKPYQIRQFLKIVERYNLRLEDNE